MGYEFSPCRFSGAKDSVLHAEWVLTYMDNGLQGLIIPGELAHENKPVDKDLVGWMLSGEKSLCFAEERTLMSIVRCLLRGSQACECCGGVCLLPTFFLCITDADVLSTGNGEFHSYYKRDLVIIIHTCSHNIYYMKLLRKLHFFL